MVFPRLPSPRYRHPVNAFVSATAAAGCTVGFEGLASDFAREALELLDQLERLLLDAESGSAAAARAAAPARRLLHTLKGNAGLVGAAELQAALHRLEDLAARLSPEDVAGLLAALEVVRAEAQAIAEGRAPDAAGESLRRLLAEGVVAPAAGEAAPSLGDEIRVPRRRLDGLLAVAGDLFVQRTRLEGLTRAEASPDARTLRDAADRLSSSLRELHALLLELHLVPAGSLFERLRRVVRDEGRRQGKAARLGIRGAEVRADRLVLERLAAPLMHLVRNALVHGIETPEERAGAGKPAEGVVVLAAALQGTQLEVVVEDDGRGLDREALARRAAALGLDASRPGEELIFEPGLSTASLTSSAGRGVGLDAVKLGVFGVGGTVEVASVAGRGTRFVLRVPRSVAIERALLCRVAEETYAIPVACVLDASRTGPQRVRWLGKGPALEHAGALLPLVDTARVLGVAPVRGDYALVLHAGQRAALRVDALLGQEDFVFQALDEGLRGAAPVTAAALLADGSVVFRLDPELLVSATARGA